MTDTHFVNCTGLDDGPNAALHRTSAYDIALMSRELLKNHPDIRKFTTIWMDSVRGGAFGLSNTNKLIRFYRGATGLKTGFTSGAGYCLSASAERDGMELIAVVMGCETSKQRSAACKAMLDYGFANYTLAAPEAEESCRVPVRLGRSKMVAVKPAREEAVLIEKGKQDTLNTEVTLVQEVDAPVSLGQTLGTVTLRSGETVLLQIPLAAAEPVERLSWAELFVMVMKKAAMAR